MESPIAPAVQSEAGFVQNYLLRSTQCMSTDTKCREIDNYSCPLNVRRIRVSEQNVLGELQN